MIKRIISSVLTISMLCTTHVAFAGNSLTNTGNNGTIDTDILTDENVLYRSIQNEDNFSFFGLGDNNDEINADFDVVMSFDMSYSMYEYDVNGSKLWLDSFRAISEQAPGGTRYAMVSPNSLKFTNDLGTVIDKVQEMEYTGTSDIISVLDNSKDIFDNDSINRNRIVVASVHEVSDEDGLGNKLKELRARNIIPFVFVLNADADNPGIDGVYICGTDLELRLAVSDLYLALSEFNMAASATQTYTATANDSAAAYKGLSDFRPERHSFESDFGNSNGLMMASILNMYKCVPLKAGIGAEGSTALAQQYDLFNLNAPERLQHFILAQNKEFGSVPQSFQQVWDEIFYTVENNDSIISKDSSKTVSIISKNMKRRFPVMIQHDNKWEIVYEYGGIIDRDSAELSYNGTSSIEYSDVDAVFDTYEYLVTTANKAVNLYDIVSRNNSELIIETLYPSDYNFIVNSENSVDDTIRRDALDGKEGYIELSSSDNTLYVIARYTGEYTERNFVVGSLTTFIDGLADIYGANKVYYTRYYTDVSVNDWFHEYVFKATNLGIVSGTDENKFEPNEPITLEQLFKMIMETAKVDFSTEPGSSTDYWAYEYMLKADELGLIDISGKSLEEIEELGGKIVRRGEAAKYICQMFYDNRDSVNVPTLLYDDVEKITNYRSVAFDRIKDVTGDENRDYIYKLYMNGVMNGRNETTMAPQENVERAEICTLLIKCLFDMDENIPIIEANVEQLPQNEPIPIDVNTTETIINNIEFYADYDSSSVEYEIHINNDHGYIIETTGEMLGNTDTILAGVLTGSSGTILTPIRGKQSIDAHDTPDMETNRHILYTVQGAGNYTLKLLRTGTGTINLKITDMEYAQTLMFNSTSGEYYIFDDNPEFIRRCDILDDPEYEPRALMHAYNLGPGAYNVFSFHHVETRSTKEFAFNIGDVIYFDAVITNSTDEQSKVNINKLGYYSFNDHEWGCRNHAYEDYTFGNNQVKDISVGEDGWWLSDLKGSKLINRNSERDVLSQGMIHLLMEFEVVEGAVDFCTVAYKNNNKSYIKEQYMSNKPVSKLQFNSPTLKGMAETSQAKRANELIYIVDETQIGKTLDVNIENQFYDKHLADGFVCNHTPWGHIYHFSGSSSSNLKFNGIIEYEDNEGNLIDSENRIWYFDGLHSQFPYESEIPDSVDFEDYNTREPHVFFANELLDSDWIKSVPDSANVEDILREFNAYYASGDDEADSFNKPTAETHRVSRSFIDYGITHQIPIRVFNNSDRDLIFTYDILCTRLHFYGRYTYENGSTTLFGKLTNIGDDIVEQKEQKEEIVLKAHEWTSIEINSNLLAGGSGEIRHTYKISGQEE